MSDHEEIRSKLRFSVFDGLDPSGNHIGLELMKMVKAVQDSTLLLNSRLERHMEIEEENMARTGEDIRNLNGKVEKIVRLVDAFPTDANGHPDVMYHRGYHEEKREAEQTSAKLWGGVRQRLAENAANALMVAVAVLLLLGLKTWIIEQASKTTVDIPAVSAQKDNHKG